MQKSKNKCLSGGRGKGPYPTPFHLVVLFQKERLRNLDLADKIDCNVKSWVQAIESRGGLGINLEGGG